MSAQYYGVIKWFDMSKGFGAANTIDGKSIFILSRNIDKFPKEGDLISIDEIQEDKARRRLDARGVVVWKESDALSEMLFEKWRNNKDLGYCNEIAMLLRICDELLLDKIIETNKEKWLADEDFIKYLAITCNRREIGFSFDQNLYKRITEMFLKVVADFYFDVWQKHRKYKGYLSYMFSIYGSRNELSYEIKHKLNTELLNKVLAIDHNWIYESEFSVDFNPSSVIILFIEKKIVYDFMIARIISKGTKEYNKDFIWLINNGNDSIINFIIEDINLFSNLEFVNQFKANRRLYSNSSYSKFLTSYIISQNDLTISDDFKWLLKNGRVEDLRQLINVNRAYWQNNLEFVKHLLSFKSVYNRKRDYHRTLNTEEPLVVEYQIEAYQDFIYDIWKSKGKIIFDDYMDWLLANGEGSFLHSVFEIEKKIWINEKSFLDFILKNKFKLGRDRIFLEAFFLEMCLNTEHFYHNEAITWLFAEGSHELFKVYIAKKLNYTPEAVDKIHLAFYPLNDSLYYYKKAWNSNWSADFKDKYIQERNEQSNSRFRRLLKEELEMIEIPLVIKKWKKKNTHTATDLANFAFCPASYFLNQKYDLNIEEQENVFIGINEHNKQRLLRLADRRETKEQKINSTFKSFYVDFARILKAKAIAQGHGTIKPVIYYSKKGKIAGIPDYVFKDEISYFAVEEKFTFKKFEELTELYYSHKIQALTYLYGLDEFSFSEVFVVYWFVKKDQNGNHKIYNYRIFPVMRSDANKTTIVDTFNAVDSLDTSQTYNLPKSFINYNKCIRCNYFKICEYKK
jgi:CRISPR/Cas system-associated exonuclease Cas4 (RecB family)/cold shock CspA family protein